MKLETFFDKFELFAGAPNAVQKMRELILELAVRGKLAEQLAADQQDKGWRALIETIDSDSENTEDQFSIPDSWRWVRLNDLGDTKPRNDLADTVKVSFVPMTLIPAEYGQSAKSEERAWGDIKKGYTHFADSDVVMAKITPCFENGKSCVMGKLQNGVGAGTTELHVFRKTIDVVIPQFVLIYLKSGGFIERGIPRMTGSAGQKRVPHDYFANSPFPLPPPGEQKRIVAKVDELMALCDRLEAQQNERQTRHTALARAAVSRFADAPTPANLDFIFHNAYVITPADLRKTILTLAVQGQLEVGLIDESVSDDVLAASKGAEISTDELPTIPSHWVWVSIGSVVTRMDSGWSPACLTEPAGPEDWGVLKTTAVQTLEYQEHQNKRLPPNLKPRPENEVMDGDILFTRAGPMNRVGILCVARPTRKRLMLSDKIIRFHLVEGIDPRFGALALSAGFSGEFVEGLKSGMAESQVNISQPKLKAVPIAVPPLAEQRRIVAKVDELMKLVDQLEAQLAASTQQAEQLMQAIVAELAA